MYTVLLADDEDSVLDILKNSISWQELGVDSLLTAADGRIALDLFEQQRIDLLVTDIRMPRLSGIELISAVRQLYPDTHCILLTAYSEFDYAKEAIRLGVENYLLKPVAKEEVEQTVRNALNNLYQKRRNSETLLHENILRRWAGGMIGSEELSERAAVFGINLYRSAYCAVLVVKKTRVSIAAFRSACVEALSRTYDVNRFWDEKGRYVMVLGGKAVEPAGVETTLAALAESTGLQGAVAVAIGAPVAEADLLHLSYQAACDAIELADLAGSAVVIPKPADAQGFDADLLAEEILALYNEPDAEDRLNGFKHLAGKLYKQTANKPAKAVLDRLLRGCIHVLLKSFPQENGLRESMYRHGDTPAALNDKELFARAAIALLQKGYGLFSDCFQRFSPIVQVAVHYVRGCILNGDGVSIKEFCAKNGMNPAYLGHLFKKETGLFFNDYLMQCRIDRSVVMLRNPNRKVKDIAQEIGFASTSYFVKCFREYKGVPPAKYRLELHADEGYDAKN